MATEEVVAPVEEQSETAAGSKRSAEDDAADNAAKRPQVDVRFFLPHALKSTHVVPVCIFLLACVAVGVGLLVDDVHGCDGALNRK